MNPLETYLSGLLDAHLGGAVAETSGYHALATLLDAVGDGLKPKVRCILHPKNRGAGIPDGGLYTPDQYDRSGQGAQLALHAQIPARGVIEVKPVAEEIGAVVRGEQVERYLREYRQVLVTNYREFLLVGYDEEGRVRELERYTLAQGEAEFWQMAEHVRRAARVHGEPLAEYLKRVMLRSASLASPQDVAWFLASYARDARARIEHTELPSLRATRESLEAALGI